MVVVVPYVDGMLHPDTIRAVHASGLSHRFVQMDRGDRSAYARTLARLWWQRTTFIIVEQDIVPTLDQLEELTRCGHGWCVHEYDDGLSPGSPKLGLARFGAQLLCDEPGLAERALRQAGHSDRYRDWGECDVRLVRDLWLAGYQAHTHEPPVAHLKGWARSA